MSAFRRTITVTVPAAAQVSEKFPVGEFQRGSFRTTTAGNEGAVNFDVSMDGVNWDTLALASGGAFADVTMPAQNLPRALPASLFSFSFARVRTSIVQAGADAVFVIDLWAN